MVFIAQHLLKVVEQGLDHRSVLGLEVSGWLVLPCHHPYRE